MLCSLSRHATHARSHAPLQVEARQRTSSDASSSIVAGRCCGESDRGSTCCARADCLRMRCHTLCPLAPPCTAPHMHGLHARSHTGTRGAERRASAERPFAARVCTRRVALSPHRAWRAACVLAWVRASGRAGTVRAGPCMEGTTIARRNGAGRSVGGSPAEATRIRRLGWEAQPTAHRLCL